MTDSANVQNADYWHFAGDVRRWLRVRKEIFTALTHSVGRMKTADCSEIEQKEGKKVGRYNESGNH